MSRLLTTGVLQQARNFGAQKQYALSFDGVDDYVDCLLMSDFYSDTQELTIQLKTENFIHNNGGILSFGDINDTRPFILIRNYDSGYIDIYNYGNGYIMTNIVISLLDIITLTYSNNNWAVFVNGILMDSFVGAIIYQLIPLKIANGYPSFWAGELSDVQIWNIARTQQQIQDDLNKKLTGTEPGLVAYYDFSEGEGNILHDKTQNGNNGTIHGAQWIEI